jgi:hypothetical protein
VNPTPHFIRAEMMKANSRALHKADQVGHLHLECGKLYKFVAEIPISIVKKTAWMAIAPHSRLQEIA